MTGQEHSQPDESALAAAAAELDGVIARTLDELADRLLDRPAVGSPAWYRCLHHQQQHPESGQVNEQDWQLVKLRISTRAGTNPATLVGAARAVGASWHDIAAACGLTTQAAYRRWR